jgi:single-strand DNA-binding protein
MPRKNLSILVGHIGNNPDFHTFENGARSAMINVATDDSYRDRTSGDIVKRTEWHRIVFYGDKLIENIEKFQTESPLKGSQVLIEGKLRTRSWEDEAKIKRYTTEIVVTDWEGFQLLGKKTDGKAPAAPPPEQIPPGDSAQATGGDVPA